MNKNFCDRCGNEFHKRDLLLVHVPFDLTINGKEIDLCFKCSRKFEVWMKNK